MRDGEGLRYDPSSSCLSRHNFELQTSVGSMGMVKNTYIYHKNQPNVGEYIIHGFYGT